MADLIVDYDLLSDCAEKLKEINKFLDGLTSRVDHDGDIWGDSKISDAMHTFGTNWSYHREKLQDLIGKGAEKFENSKDTFQQNDQSLAQTLVDGGRKGQA